MAAWADLPLDLLISISDRLDITSCLRFSAVCTTWASTLRKCLPTFPRFCLDQPIPWLILDAGTSKNNPNLTDFVFYDLTTSISYTITIPISFSLDVSRWLGSNFGWLVFIDLKLQLHLVSPLTGAQVLLPSIKISPGNHGLYLTNYWDPYGDISNWHPLQKVIICRAPDHSSGNDIGLLLLGLFLPQGLAVLKVGDDKWTWLDIRTCYNDAIIFRGKIYAMSEQTLHCWELKDSSFKAGKVLTIPNTMLDGLKKRYLVKFGGKLLMVCRERKWDNIGHTMSVYQLNLDQRDWLWCPLKSIGDNAVFIGLGYSNIVSTVGLDGAQRNCIYYAHDDYLYKLHETFYGYHDSGIYNLKKGTYEIFPVAYSRPPAWFWPCDVK